MEVRPCVGRIERGDQVAPADTRTGGFFTVRQATPEDTPVGVAVTGAHALGFVAFERFKHAYQGSGEQS
jgi:hypothetical protein